MAIRNLTGYGFEGEVLPVHRDGGTLLGQKVYPDVASVPIDPDLAILGVSPARVPDAIEQLAGRGCRKVVLIADGYVERADDVGAARTAELAELCARLDVELVGPNGIGVACFASGLVPICEPIPAGVQPGHVSIISHSGALISGILDGFVAEGVGVNTVVSVGNGTVTNLLDWLEWTVDDSGTRTVACYAEGIGDLARFRDIALRAAGNGTLIVLLAAGRSRLARDIALSHTASIAGDHDLLDAVCADTGVARVPDVETLVTACHLQDRGLAQGPLVITSSGGAATLTADLAADAGLTLPQLSAASATLLGDVVSASGHIGNPMDLTASRGLDGPARRRLYEALLRDEHVGGGLCVLPITFPDEEGHRGMHRDLISSLAEASERTGRHVVLTPIGDQAVTDWVSRTVAAAPRLGLVRSLRRATEALGILQRRARHVRAEPVRQERSGTRADDTEWMSESTAKAMLAARGFPVVRGVRVASSGDLATAELPGDGPYVVKGVVREVAHKARLGLVKLGIPDSAAVRCAAEDVENSARAHGFADRFEGLLIEQQVAGFELMAATRWSMGVGFLTLAVGGTLVEAVRTGASVALPWHPGSWASLLDRSGLRAVLETLPDGAETAVHSLCEALARDVVDGELAAFETVELNPVIVDSSGNTHIADALLLRSDGGR
ncbi:hypothetical protein BAY60_19620 [Prauserella muralis]|uniref:CoA-binding domain-containing protein n=2 Tax=Prauserella muralis TaxID=588067 RepID=A0A2V4AVN9_9PSEU|nr:hypothetical protein BAY60_19620 [Prauserella muralis]